MSLPPETWTRWRQSRVAELTASDSWLSVMGLVWLDGPVLRVGAAPDAGVHLPDGAAHAGEFRELERQWCWIGANGVTQPLQIDREGVVSVPTVISIDRYRLSLIEREGRLAARVRDTRWAESRPFAGLELYPYNPLWVLDAEWEALAEPLTLEVPSVTGDLKPRLLTHRARWFSEDGTEQILLPISQDEGAAFFVFRDRSSGRETYGAGRFLRAPLPTTGSTLCLDFNFSYNPPCAFTDFATCPLPPPENWLGFPIPAGELNYAKV